MLRHRICTVVHLFWFRISSLQEAIPCISGTPAEESECKCFFADYVQTTYSRTISDSRSTSIRIQWHPVPSLFHAYVITWVLLITFTPCKARVSVRQWHNIHCMKLWNLPIWWKFTRSSNCSVKFCKWLLPYYNQKRDQDSVTLCAHVHSMTGAEEWLWCHNYAVSLHDTVKTGPYAIFWITLEKESCTYPTSSMATPKWD